MSSHAESVRRILIVDDDPADISILKRAFKTTAAQVEIYETTEPLKAAPLAEECRPDLVCVDLKMPLLDGAGVVAALRADRDHDTRALVVISSSDRPEDIRESYEKRANAYYVKPTTLDGYRELARTVTEHWFSAARVNVPS